MRNLTPIAPATPVIEPAAHAGVRPVLAPVDRRVAGDAASGRTARMPADSPVRLLRSGLDLGWTQIRVGRYREQPQNEGFVTARTPDLTVIVVACGSYRIESVHGASVRRAQFRRGSVAVTAPGRSDHVRWSASGPATMESVHVSIPRSIVDGVADLLGVSTDLGRLDTLDLQDGVVGALAVGLDDAVASGQPSAYAEQLARALVARLLVRGAGSSADGAPRAVKLHELAIEEVVDHIELHLHEELRVDALAVIAHMSPFHFLRVFRQATGTTPHRFLTDRRMDRAASLLSTTDLPIRDVAALCAYSSRSQFTTAFRRSLGVSPSEHREATRGSATGALRG